jgi:hypothetical protein
VPGFFLVTAGSLVGGARDKVCVPGWEAKDRWAGPFYGLFSNYRSTNLLFFLLLKVIEDNICIYVKLLNQNDYIITTFILLYK